MEPSEAASPEHFDPEELVGLPLLGVRDLGMAVERFLESELAILETSLIEMRVLSVCAAHPGCTAVEVSRIIPVDPPAISRVVQPLVQRGLLSRRRSRTDRREVRLRVTDDGVALLGECHR